jgi:hypothetical protein
MGAGGKRTKEGILYFKTGRKRTIPEIETRLILF